VSCTKTAEPIEMPSGYMDSGGPKEACIRVQIPMRRGQFLGERTCPGMPDDNTIGYTSMPKSMGRAGHEKFDDMLNHFIRFASVTDRRKELR